MNQQVKPEDLLVSIPLRASARSMTRREKLYHWASIVRDHPCGTLALMHNLEFVPRFDLDHARIVDILPPYTAMSIAVRDPLFVSLGLSRETTIGGLMNFMALTQHELHEFSCDCGGAIDNREQARRIEHLASR